MLAGVPLDQMERFEYGAVEAGYPYGQVETPDKHRDNQDELFPFAPEVHFVSPLQRGQQHFIFPGLLLQDPGDAGKELGDAGRLEAVEHLQPLFSAA